MRLDVDWSLYFGIGFIICILYFIMDRSWVNLIGVGIYSLIVFSFHTVRLIKKGRKEK